MEENYRKLCQVFTPTENVKELLDWCEYREDLYGKKIMENSCGDGHILQEVVKRYIEDCLKNKFSKYKIKDGLNNDIHAIEYDSEQYDKCKKNLNTILKHYNIGNIKWSNIINDDTLKNGNTQKFDFVVGNPPYIKYKSLSIEDRNYIKNKFKTCKSGKFDYCYAFIEKSIDSLKDGGMMAYLIPSSVFKNVFAEELRQYIKPHILRIYDYTSIKLFTKETINQDRLTSSSVMILKKNSNEDDIEYIDIAENNTLKIQKDNLVKKWIFKDNTTDNSKKNKFSDYFYASNTIATLCNKAYVISQYTETDEYICTKDGYEIEKDILRDTISPKNFKKGKKEKIIFPYYYENGELRRYSQEEFEERFPKACKYLKKYSVFLENRKSDKNAKWFEYGRSQALRNSNRKKILLSTVITNEVKLEILSEDNIPYSGIYIIQKGNKSLKVAEKILKSNNFFKYIQAKGINASGNSIRITSQDINEFMF